MSASSSITTVADRSDLYPNVFLNHLDEVQGDDRRNAVIPSVAALFPSTFEGLGLQYVAVSTYDFTPEWFIAEEMTGIQHPRVGGLMILHNAEYVKEAKAVCYNNGLDRWKAVCPNLPPFGSNHSKFIIAFYEDPRSRQVEVCRFLLTSQNLIRNDIHQKSGSMFFQDFYPFNSKRAPPARSSPLTSPSVSDFGEVLGRYFREVERLMPRKGGTAASSSSSSAPTSSPSDITPLIERLRLIDFSPATVALVPTMPYEYSGQSLYWTGQTRIAYLLYQERLWHYRRAVMAATADSASSPPSPAPRRSWLPPTFYDPTLGQLADVDLIFQCSSLGTMNAKAVEQDLWASFHGLPAKEDPKGFAGMPKPPAPGKGTFSEGYDGLPRNRPYEGSPAAAFFAGSKRPREDSSSASSSSSTSSSSASQSEIEIPAWVRKGESQQLRPSRRALVDRIHLIVPSFAQILDSLEGLRGGGSVPIFKAKLKGNKYMRQLAADYDASVSGRERGVPHIKSFELVSYAPFPASVDKLLLEGFDVPPLKLHNPTSSKAPAGGAAAPAAKKPRRSTSLGASDSDSDGGVVELLDDSSEDDDDGGASGSGSSAAPHSTTTKAVATSSSSLPSSSSTHSSGPRHASHHPSSGTGSSGSAGSSSGGKAPYVRLPLFPFLMTGSHNLSGAAVGVLQKAKATSEPMLRNMSFELGWVCLPSFVAQADSVNPRDTVLFTPQWALEAMDPSIRAALTAKPEPGDGGAYTMTATGGPRLVGIPCCPYRLPCLRYTWAKGDRRQHPWNYDDGHEIRGHTSLLPALLTTPEEDDALPPPPRRTGGGDRK